MLLLQIAPFVVVALISSLAVFHSCFDDNLLQRIGLSCISIGACLRIAADVVNSQHTGGAVNILVMGLAVYAVGTVFKFRSWNARIRKLSGPDSQV